MNKRILSAVLSCALILSLALSIAPAASALGSLANFSKSRTYEAGMFTDVAAGAWYEPYVSRAYEYALVDGNGAGGFNPLGKVTLGEAVKLAVSLNAGYYGRSLSGASEGEWYKPYVSYAKQYGILREDYANYNAAATRADFVALIGAALPDEAVTAINRIDDGALPDVSQSYSYGPAVYKLFRAGVLTGGDKRGTFYPGRSIQRAEAATICVRMLDAEARVEQTIAGELRPEELYSKSVSAVFFIEIFNKAGELIKTGSGFFINKDGDAVTNYHVVIGGHSAKITTHDGKVYDVLGIYSYQWKQDMAILKVGGGGSFNYLPLGNSDAVMTGETVYAIGSPLGLQSTISRGIISSAVRYVNGVQYIQTDTPLSHGSSGGPLLSSGGLVIGITSAGAEDGQNVNLAVPINLVKQLDRTQWVTLESLIMSTVYYRDFPSVPDLGAFAGVSAFRSQSSKESADFSYKVSDFDKSPQEVLDDYRQLLEQNLYSLFGYYSDGENIFDAYYGSSTGLLVMFGTEKIGRTECITVFVRPLI